MDPVNTATLAVQAEETATSTEETIVTEEPMTATVATEEVPCLTTSDMHMLVQASNGDPLTFFLLLGALLLSGALFKNLGEQRRLKQQLVSKIAEVRALKQTE